MWWGDDSGLLQTALDGANKQFRVGQRNLLVIVPTLRESVFSHRRLLTRAFLGDLAIEIPIDIERGGPAGPDRLVTIPKGRFVNKIKGGREPGFTRVSAVLCIEEEYVDPYWDRLAGISPTGLPPAWIEPRAVIMHNPHAAIPLSRTAWSSMPQFLEERDEKWAWTDGRSPWL